jgi:hypothetical protein
MSEYKYAPKRADSQTVLEKREAIERANLESAALILRQPDVFGGDFSLAVRWARAFLANRKVAA